MRASTIIYRSFYEAVKDLPKENQADIWCAIFEYALNFNEVKLDGINKTIFTLIRPQIDANIKRYNNGIKPKTKQKESKIEATKKQKRSKQEANVNDNVNVNDNGNDNKNVNKELKYPYSSVGFLQKWETLVSQPKWKKKSHSALQESLNKLSKVSEQEAIEMMSNSISGNWQGIFPLNNKNTPTLFTPQTERPKIGIPEI